MVSQHKDTYLLITKINHPISLLYVGWLIAGNDNVYNQGDWTLRYRDTSVPRHFGTTSAPVRRWCPLPNCGLPKC